MNAGSKFVGRTMMWLLLSGVLVTITPTATEAQVVTSKRCSRCQSFLPLSASVGGSCPSCGAYFTGEQHEYSGGQSGSGMQELFWQAWLQQKQWEQQQRLLAQQAKTARMQEVRDKIAADRSALYERVQEKTEEFRQQDDPQRRALRYLESAARCEAEGDRRAAAAYYRLTQRIVPDSDAGRRASFALARLQLP